MKIGIVDLDTSHPQNWIPIERELGHDVLCVWDGGSVHPPQYVVKFAEEHKISRLHRSLDDMAQEVDCAILHGCDWDSHIEKARPFVEAGKSVLIDKPIAGRRRDLDQVREWVNGGARISGGSSLRFCYETRDWMAKPVEERGQPHTVLCGCGVDEFNYGIHAYAMLSGILGPGIDSVRHLGGEPQRRLHVKWNDGRQAFLVIGKSDSWQPFYAAVVTNKGVLQYQADAGRLYRALLEAVLPYLAGDADSPPVPIDSLLEPELCALAARRSWSEVDREVFLSELVETDAGYDGKSFAEEYRRARYPQ